MNKLTFPCHFPIKIMGDNSPEFIQAITQIVQHQYADCTDITHSFSKNKRFVSITATVYAHSQQELDVLYKTLQTHNNVKIVL